MIPQYSSYIYLPIISYLPSSLFSNLFSSTVCFSFVYVWHGTVDFVLIWSLLNFLGITLEGVARAVSTQPAYRRLEDRMSEQAARRLHALLASPVLIMSSLSNFYFFAGTQVSNSHYKLFDPTLSAQTPSEFCIIA